jgi:NAD(P)H dehydrogenase (quinone)
MRVLIAYSTRTGNTKKVAESVAEGVREEGADVLLKRAKDVELDELIEANAIIVGSPVYFGTMSAEVKEMFDRSVAIRGRLKDKVGAAFCTAGHPTGGKETTLLSILCAMLIHQMIIVADPIEAGGHYGIGTVKGPTEQEQEEARQLGKRVVLVAKRLYRSA